MEIFDNVTRTVRDDLTVTIKSLGKTFTALSVLSTMKTQTDEIHL